MVDASEIQTALLNGLPSQRALAAELVSRDPDLVSRDVLAAALTQEPVESIRALLEEVVSRTVVPSGDVTSMHAGQATHDLAALNDANARLAEIAGLILHETEPAIGWLRRAASNELGGEFEMSATNRAIETLRARIAGLVTLTETRKPVSWVRTDLAGALTEVIDAAASRRIDRKLELMSVAEIDTDRELFDILMSNALRNALEASASVDHTDQRVLVETGGSQDHFWITVTNRFDGSSFELDEVANTGMSSKSDHKGYGVTAMRYAAERLGYSLALTGRAGVAMLNLSGARFHD